MGTTINRTQRNPISDSVRPRRRKRSPVKNNSNSNNNNGGRERSQGQDDTMIARLRAKNLVMGQVKILKRGEDLTLENDEMATNQFLGGDDLVLSSTDRLGPEPETVLKQIRVSDLEVVEKIYAGPSASFSSPPPSSLPFPAFFGKKEKIGFDSATSDLRRLLGLDLL